jgi:exonuclease III
MSKLEDLNDTITQQQPKILIITETHLKSCRHGSIDSLRTVLSDYRVYLSSIPGKKEIRKSYSNKDMDHRGYAGVLLAVHKSLAHPEYTSIIPVPNTLHGYIVHIKISYPNSNPLHIIGTYCTPTDNDIRTNIYDTLNQKVKTIAYDNEQLLLAGDWNAVLTPVERSCNKLHPQDHRHIAFIKELGLTPLCHPRTDTPRPFTYTAHGYSDVATNTFARLDDVYILRNEENKLSDITREYILTTAGTSDHHPLMHHIHPATITVFPPAAPTEHTGINDEHKIKFPLSEEQLAKAKDALQMYHTVASAMLAKDIADIKNDLMRKLNGDWTAGSLTNIQNNTMNPQIDSLSGRITILLQACNTTAMSVWPSQPSGPRRAHLPRITCKKYRKLIMQSKILRIASLRLRHHIHNNTPLTDTVQDVLHCTSLVNKSICHTVPQPPLDTNNGDTKQILTQWLCVCESNRKNVTEEIQKIRHSFQLKQNQTKKKRQQQLLNTRPRVAHKKIFQDRPTATTYEKLNDVDSRGPVNMRHPDTKAMETTAKGVLDAFHSYYTKLMTPDQPKSGTYLTSDPSSRTPDQRYPWTKRSGVEDSFSLETHATPLVQKNTELLRCIADRTTFNNCLCHLAHSKQPGPDGIVNELLQILPPPLQTAIHDIMIIMWISGHTPDAFKASDTIVLYKSGAKSDPCNPKDYRPIGLANSLYKLWTCMITETLSTYAEKYHILSNNQEGFRKHKNTIRQAQQLMLVLEDALLHSQTLYNVFFFFFLNATYF